MEKTISDLFNFIKSIFVTYWLIITKPADFELNFLKDYPFRKKKLKQNDHPYNSEKEQNKIINPYLFFGITASLFAYLISDFNKENSKDFLLDVFSKFSKGFSFDDLIKTVFPIFFITWFTAFLLSKLFFLKNKDFSRMNLVWILYIFSFCLFTISIFIIILTLIDATLNTYNVRDLIKNHVNLILFFGTIVLLNIFIFPFIIVYKHRKQNKNGFFQKRHYGMNFFFPILFLGVLLNQLIQDERSHANPQIFTEPLPEMSTKKNTLYFSNYENKIYLTLTLSFYIKKEHVFIDKHAQAKIVSKQTSFDYYDSLKTSKKNNPDRKNQDWWKNPDWETEFYIIDYPDQSNEIITVKPYEAITLHLAALIDSSQLNDLKIREKCLYSYPNSEIFTSNVSIDIIDEYSWAIAEDCNLGPYWLHFKRLDQLEKSDSTTIEELKYLYAKNPLTP